MRFQANDLHVETFGEKNSKGLKGSSKNVVRKCAHAEVSTVFTRCQAVQKAIVFASCSCKLFIPPGSRFGKDKALTCPSSDHRIPLLRANAQ